MTGMGVSQLCFLCMKSSFLRGLQNRAVLWWSYVIHRWNIAQIPNVFMAWGFFNLKPFQKGDKHRSVVSMGKGHLSVWGRGIFLLKLEEHFYSS